MISSSHRLIYIHIPKTGGNSVQELLLPLSDDRKVSGGPRDGIERFEVEGVITPNKHATLADYAEKLGDVSGFNIVATIRNPIERAVSYYFSPHRWKSQAGDGSWSIARPTWDLKRFVAMLPEVKPTADFLKIRGRIATGINFLRFDNLSADFAELVTKLNLPVSVRLAHRNKSASDEDFVSQVLADPGVKAAVKRRFAEDLELFRALPAWTMFISAVAYWSVEFCTDLSCVGL